MSRERSGGTKGACPECGAGIPTYRCAVCGEYDIPQDHECAVAKLIDVINRQRGDAHRANTEHEKLVQENADLRRTLDLLLTKWASRGY